MSQKHSSPGRTAGAAVSLLARRGLQVLLLQRLNGVFTADLPGGIEHGGEHHHEHAAHGDGHAVPRDVELGGDALGHAAIDAIGHQHRYRQAPQQRPCAVDDALVVHHPGKAPLGQSHGSQHGELPAAQGDGGGDGVEHVGHGDQGDEDDIEKIMYVMTGSSQYIAQSLKAFENKDRKALRPAGEKNKKEIS